MLIRTVNEILKWRKKTHLKRKIYLPTSHELLFICADTTHTYTQTQHHFSSSQWPRSDSLAEWPLLKINWIAFRILFNWQTKWEKKTHTQTFIHLVCKHADETTIPFSLNHYDSWHTNYKPFFNPKFPHPPMKWSRPCNEHYWL